jgi:acyl-coenzyme A thioesterase PaaI-like protein
LADKHPAQILFTDKHPLTAALNMKFEGVIDHTLTVTLKAPASFADQDGEHTHTGFTTLFLDTVMGSCVLGEMSNPQTIATIKLTTNHIERACVGEAIICQATYDSEHNEIAYVSGKVFAGDERRLIASAIGTFMIGTATKSIREKS